MKNIKVIFKLLKNELKNYKRPFVSEWAEVVKDPFSTLISCLLSLRTKDDVTAKASLRLLKKHNTPQKILNLSQKQIEMLIYPVGFYRTKAKRIRDISKTLIEKYDGNVPADFDELMKLKGVGKKTASIVMVYGHKKADYIPVDSHVHQISNRLGWVETRTPEQTMEALMKKVPKKFWYGLNELFVQFGQAICVPISPFCSRCPVRMYCRRVGVRRSR